MISNGLDELKAVFPKTKLSKAEEILENDDIIDVYQIKNNTLECEIQERSNIIITSAEIKKESLITKCSCRPGVSTSLIANKFPFNPDLCYHQIAFILYLDEYFGDDDDDDDDESDIFDDDDDELDENDYDLESLDSIKKLFDANFNNRSGPYSSIVDSNQIGLRFQFKLKGRKKSQSKKYAQSVADFKKYFESLNDYKIITYFLLYSDHYFNNDLIEKTFKMFINEFTNKKPMDLFTEKRINLKMVESNKQALGIVNKDFVQFIENQSEGLFLRLKNYKEGDILTFDIKVAEEKTCPTFLPMLVIRLISILVDENKILTQNNMFIAKFEKLFKKDLYQFVPKEIPEEYFPKLLEFTITLIFVSGFVKFFATKVEIEDSYCSFLGLTESEQMNYLQNSYLNHVKSQKIFSVSYSLNDYYYLTHYLLSYFLDPKRLDKENNSALLFKAEILFDFYKNVVDNVSKQYNYVVNFDKLKISSSENQIDQKIYFKGLFNSQASDIRLSLDWILLIDFYSLGVLNYLKNQESKVFGYKFIFPPPIKTNKTKPVYKNKFICMPDFTLKAEITSLEPKKLRNLMKFTKVISLDKIVNLKLYKEGIWKYLDENKSIEEFVGYLTKLCSNEIPSNVELTIRSWGKQYGSIQVIDGSIITVPEPALIDAVLKSKLFKDISIIRLSPTIICVHSDRRQKIISYLQKQSFHVKEVSIPFTLN